MIVTQYNHSYEAPYETIGSGFRRLSFCDFIDVDTERCTIVTLVTTGNAIAMKSLRIVYAGLRQDTGICDLSIVSVNAAMLHTDINISTVTWTFC